MFQQLLCLGILIGYQHLHATTLCPSSGMVNTLMDGMFSYPEELFSQQILAASPTYHRYNCSARGRPVTSYPYSCLIPSPCPVTDRQLNEAQRAQGLNYRHSLCRLRENLRSPSEAINLIVLGGSVPAGRESGGCCCSKTDDERCTFTPSGHFCTWLGFGGECSWPSRLSRWMKSIASSSINFHNLAKGGFTSELTADSLDDRLRSVQINSLRETDIVLLDHSFNDASVFEPREQGHKDLEQALESLIQRIFSLSVEGSWPTVVLLETYHRQSGNWSYSSVYKTVAEKYSLPLWSIRSIILSPQFKKDYPQLSRLSGLELVRVGDRHPNWIVHLWYSDVIARLLESELSRCFNSRGSWRARSAKEMTINQLLAMSVNSSSTESSRCDPQYEPSIRFIAHDVAMRPVTNNGDQTQHFSSQMELVSAPLGMMVALPNASWPLLDHGMSRFAWTSTFSKYTQDPQPLPSHILQVTANQSFAEDLQRASYLFKIHYLRTYENAGKAEIYFCGKYITTLDALWPNSASFHFSYPELFYFERNPFQNQTCDGGSPSIEIRHTWLSLSNETERVTRDLQKFSIFSIKVCRTV